MMPRLVQKHIEAQQRANRRDAVLLCVLLAVALALAVGLADAAARIGGV